MNFMFIRARYNYIQLIILQRIEGKARFLYSLPFPPSSNGMKWYAMILILIAIPADANFLNGYALNGPVLVGYVLKIRIGGICIGGIRLRFLLMHTFWMDTHWMDTHSMDTYWWDTCWTDTYWWDTHWWDTFWMDMCGICVVWWICVGYVWCEICVGYVWCEICVGYVWREICVGYVWCEIRQQSSEEPCDETSFGNNGSKIAGPPKADLKIIKTNVAVLNLVPQILSHHIWHWSSHIETTRTEGGYLSKLEFLIAKPVGPLVLGDEIIPTLICWKET